jgi:hypothetical protein
MTERNMSLADRFGGQPNGLSCTRWRPFCPCAKKSEFFGAVNVARIGAVKENLVYARELTRGLSEWSTLRQRLGSRSKINPDGEVGSRLSGQMTVRIGGFGMVGGTLVFGDAPNKMVNHGLAWSRGDSANSLFVWKAP